MRPNVKADRNAASDFQFSTRALPRFRSSGLLGGGSVIEYIHETKTTGRRLCDECGKEIAFATTCGVCGCDICADHSIHAMFVPGMSPEDRVCNQCMILGGNYVARLNELEEQKQATLQEWEQTGKSMRSAAAQYEALPEWKKRAMRSVKITQHE